MLRTLRRTSLILVWLMFALLPLRGWANLVMHLPAPAAPAAAPCHGEAAQASAEVAIEACTLCDVCHAAMLPLVGVTALGAVRRTQALPVWRSVAATDAAPDGLFRPPRR